MKLNALSVTASAEISLIDLFLEKNMKNSNEVSCFAFHNMSINPTWRIKWQEKHAITRSRTHKY